MSLTVTELAEEVRETNRRLNSSIDRLDLAVDGLRKETEDLRVDVARITNSIGWFKSIGAIVAGSAFAILIVIGTGIYRFGHVEAEITRLGKEISEVKQDMKDFRSEVKQEIGTLKGDVGQLKSDVGQLKSDVGQLKKDMAGLRDEFRTRDDRLARVLDRIEQALPPAKDRP